MQTELKLRELAADEFVREAARRPVNSEMQIDVSPERPQVWGYEGESIEAMPLEELLYYVLVGEGKIADEPA